MVEWTLLEASNLIQIKLKMIEGLGNTFKEEARSLLDQEMPRDIHLSTFLKKGFVANRYCTVDGPDATNKIADQWSLPSEALAGGPAIKAMTSQRTKAVRNN
jgi:hypothetical protein